MHKGPISGSVQPLAQINTKKGELDDGDDEMRSKMFVQSREKPVYIISSSGSKTPPLH